MKSRLIGNSIIARPDEHLVIKEEAEKLLRRAGITGEFPTPIDRLLAAADIEQITDVEEAKNSFLSTLTGDAKAAFENAWGKLRGFADLKTKVNYVAPEVDSIREKWPKLHELGHQMLPWQQVNSSYTDDARSLSPECEERFEREANDFAGQLLFQGGVFKNISTSLYPELKTVFHLANKFEASRQSTARHFALESEEPIALVSYYRSKYSFDSEGQANFILGRSHSASASFLKKYSSISIPAQLDNSHPWTRDLLSIDPFGETIKLNQDDGTSSTFLWESWWNGYNLLVLLRKKPRLKLIRDFLDL